MRVLGAVAALLAGVSAAPHPDDRPVDPLPPDPTEREKEREEVQAARKMNAAAAKREMRAAKRRRKGAR